MITKLWWFLIGLLIPSCSLGKMPAAPTLNAGQQPEHEEEDEEYIEGEVVDDLDGEEGELCLPSGLYHCLYFWD